ncbi:hypothetical protein OROHE_023117 [Orobanche hederae]
MSFSGRKRPFYTSSAAAMLLLLISLVHVLISSQNQAGAIRVFLAVEQESEYPIEPPPLPPPGGKNQTEILADYSDFNSTTTTTDGTFLDYKRTVPSCPDPLHN